MNLNSVGFTPTDPDEDLKRAQEAVQKLRSELAKARQAFNSRRMKELDTAIMNAWMISGEIEDRLKNLENRFKS